MPRATSTPNANCPKPSLSDQQQEDGGGGVTAASASRGGSYGLFFLEYSLLAEYNLLQKQRIPGVYVIPASTTPLCWYGVMFIRQGLYQHGIFRFKISIPHNYPDSTCPSLVFDDHVFHPCVDPVTHRLDLRRAFPQWKSHVNHLWQIVLYARRGFFKVDVSDPVNKEAAEIFQNDPAEFRHRVQANVDAWRGRVYDSPGTEDPHFPAFTPFDVATHEPYRKFLTKGERKMEKQIVPSELLMPKKATGLSFLSAGSLNIFSKDSSSSGAKSS